MTLRERAAQGDAADIEQHGYTTHPSRTVLVKEAQAMSETCGLHGWRAADGYPCPKCAAGSAPPRAGTPPGEWFCEGCQKPIPSQFVGSDTMAHLYHNPDHPCGPIKWRSIVSSQASGAAHAEPLTDAREDEAARADIKRRFAKVSRESLLDVICDLQLAQHATQQAEWKRLAELFKTSGMDDPAFLVGMVEAEHEQFATQQAELERLRTAFRTTGGGAIPIDLGAILLERDRLATQQVALKAAREFVDALNDKSLEDLRIGQREGTFSGDIYDAVDDCETVVVVTRGELRKLARLLGEPGEQ